MELNKTSTSDTVVVRSVSEVWVLNQTSASRKSELVRKSLRHPSTSVLMSSQILVARLLRCKRGVILLTKLVKRVFGTSPRVDLFLREAVAHCTLPRG